MLGYELKCTLAICGAVQVSFIAYTAAKLIQSGGKTISTEAQKGDNIS
jgi:hypothetical protein